ncbi:MAG: SHOCT domain-containing protein [Opitutae bacterium]
MKMLLSPRWLFLSSLVFATATAALASTSKIETLSDNTYAITRTANTGFDRDVDKFKQEAQADAAKYCADKGKTLKVVMVNSERPHFGGGYAWAKVVFQALDANDPRLTAPVAAPSTVGGTAPSTGSAAGPAPLPTQAGDLYTEILKLDDLRKRGLLTDKEFEAEKKKLLKRSK